MKRMMQTLSILMLSAFAVGVVAPPAVAGSMEIYNYDCGAKKKRGGTKVHVWATNQAGIPENRTCTESDVSIGANSYVTVNLAVNNHDGDVCEYVHLADGMVGSADSDSVNGNENVRVTCRKKGFLKMCHCNRS